MTDASLRRADELLTELVEQVETARALPMSSSCVLPRERLLDLLDELREGLPPELEHARRLIAARDSLLHDAYAEANAAREAAAAEAAATVEAANAAASRIVHDAEAQAHQLVEHGRAQHAALIEATAVHQEATRAAQQIHDEARTTYRQLRGEAEQYSLQVRADADRYAARLAADSEAYADRTLFDLVATLQRAAATAEQGRATLAQRRAGHVVADDDTQAAPVADDQTGDSAVASERVRAGNADPSEQLDDRVPA